LPTSRAQPEAPLWVVFGGLMLVMLMAALDSTIVATALPTIAADLGGLEHISWVASAYLLAQTAITPLYGKLGDLYGRKRILQGAVVLFLIGSALCGLAWSMPSLIAFRAVQGLGAGGLLVLTQAVIGDIVSPRDRGKYQGIFGGVFGLASVGGPLLGGVIVQHISWSWIFYVNVPIGLLALVVLALTLPATHHEGRPVIDYLGAGLLAGGLSGIILVTSLGGTTWEWASPQTFVAGGLGVLALVAFFLVERRAPEPVLPPSLWRQPVFRVSSALSGIVGFALFGAVTFLPLYFQTVDGDTPSESGLRMLPMMLGVLVTSIAAGQAISRIGRYKAFPVAGTAIVAVGMFLLSRLEVDTTTLTASLYLLVLGLGLGLTMQVLVLAVQNSVPYGVLGTATSGVTLLRGIGGSLGTAVFGTIFSNRLADQLATGAPKEEAYVEALTPVFLVASVVALVGFAVSWFLREEPLKATAAATSVDDAYAAPRALSALAELERSIALATDAGDRERFHRRVADRAGAASLSPGATWALVRIDEHGFAGARTLAESQGVPDERIAAVVTELRAGGLIAGDQGAPVETPEGRAVIDRVVAARREMLEELVAGDEVRSPEVAALLRRLARALVGEPP
jgi:EmrB/QacA subfamily drug resistance transporter